VLGLAGPSCSGKSTAARLVAEAAGARVFHLDAYWIPGSARPPVNGAPSYERPEQYGGQAMARDIMVYLAASPAAPVVAEGFLLFLYPDLLDLCGTRVFLKAGWQTVLARRAARAAVQGSAADGGKALRAEHAWLANGREEWLRFGAGQEAGEGVVSVDAEGSVLHAAAAVLGLWRGAMAP
jgi:uridine kinase